VLGLILLTGMLNLAVTLGADAIPLGGTSRAPSVIVGIAVDTVIASFSALTLALLYFDLKARPETSRTPEHQHAP
jgi:hypothetical protein